MRYNIFIIYNTKSSSKVKFPLKWNSFFMSQFRNSKNYSILSVDTSDFCAHSRSIHFITLYIPVVGISKHNCDSLHHTYTYVLSFSRCQASNEIASRLALRAAKASTPREIIYVYECFLVLWIT